MGRPGAYFVITILTVAAGLALLSHGCGTGAPPPVVPPASTAAVPPASLIFDLTSLMGKSPDQVKVLLKRSYFSDHYRMTQGDPYPGELEMVFLHAKGQFPEMDVAFDAHFRCHWVMYQEIQPLGYTFDQYAPLLARLGLPVDTPPDVDAPVRRAWSNWHGYSICVFQDGLGAGQNVIGQVELGRPEDHV